MTNKRREGGRSPRGLREAGSPGTWQAHKSANMRRLILEAAMQAIVEHGYARVTTQIIVERAGVSRGAMLHHFPKKLDLLVALVRHIFERRNIEFTSELAKPLDGEKGDEMKALDIYWEQSENDSFLALIELSVAARTDDQLAAAFTPVIQKVLQEAYTDRIAVFPDWEGHNAEFEAAADIVRCIVLGATVAHDIRNSKERRERIKSFTRDAVGWLRPNKAPH